MKESLLKNKTVGGRGGGGEIALVIYVKETEGVLIMQLSLHYTEIALEIHMKETEGVLIMQLSLQLSMLEA